MERTHSRPPQEVVEEVEQQTTQVPERVDLSETDELLEKIDELLADEIAEQEAAARAAYRDKLKSINFIGRRAADPCASVIRVPEYMAESLLRTGMFKESDCEGC